MTSIPFPARRATILVVDDDALITLNLADQLAELGHVALEAYSGREALTLLQTRSDIQLLVTDFSMPGMNGVELIEAAHGLYPGLPVLLTSGYAELPEGVGADYPRLEKPFREDELIRRVDELLADTASI
ncbi:MAG: hypothetical protein ABS76_30090 [Pelagibacterium sp. SCN 64-44]|nr:MAG: hypothetical protein ABS76_30090 [Pelagibacterium sp. SCN 64-44]